MRYRRLGNTGLKVSAVALGGWPTYGEGCVDKDEAQKIVEQAYALGVNYFDLADTYAFGAAEEQMGGILRQYPRHTLVIASKVFWPMSKDVNDRGLSRKHIRESIDKSLKRLGTDYLDLYFCHSMDTETPLEETVRTMHDLVTQGKILYWGTSNWRAEAIVAAHELCERFGLYKPQVEQPEYSMLFRNHVETNLLPVADAYKIGLVVWSPLAMGILTGKYDDGFPAGARLSQDNGFNAKYLVDEHFATARRLKPIADALGITRAQLALAWALRHPSVNSVITSASKAEQMQSNIHTVEIELSPSSIAAITQILEDGAKPAVQGQ